MKLLINRNIIHSINSAVILFLYSEYKLNTDSFCIILKLCNTFLHENPINLIYLSIKNHLE
jgi:uncharacterized protein YbcI